MGAKGRESRGLLCQPPPCRTAAARCTEEALKASWSVSTSYKNMLVTICTSLSSLFPGHQFINLWLTAEKHSGSDFMPRTLRRRTPQLQDQNNSSLSQLFTHVSFPASSATTLRWIRCPSVPFQPGTLRARCHRTATTPTLGRRSPEREGEAFPPPHALIFRSAPSCACSKPRQLATTSCSHTAGCSRSIELRLSLKLRCITQLPHSWQLAGSAAASENLGECPVLSDERGRCPCTERTDNF